MSDETQNHIEMPDDTSVRDAQHEKELAKRGIDTYKELADYYKSLHNEVHVYDVRRETGGLYLAAHGEQPEYTPRHNLKLDKDLDTYKELKAEVKKLMSERDDQTARYQELEARYAQELEGIDTYKELADHYKSLYVALHAHEDTGWVKGVNLHDYDHLNTKAELKRALVYLLKEREDEVHLNEHYASEVEGLTYDKLAERYKDLYKDVHKDTPIEHQYDGKDLTKIKQLDTPEELRLATMRLMWERDKLRETENHPAAPGGRGDLDLEDPDPPLPNFEAFGRPVQSSFMDSSFEGMPGIADALKAERDLLGMK